MLFCRIRPYSDSVEYTRSRSISEVKQLQAGLVLGWVTAWESPVPYPFLDFFFDSLNMKACFQNISLELNLNQIQRDIIIRHEISSDKRKSHLESIDHDQFCQIKQVCKEKICFSVGYGHTRLNTPDLVRSRKLSNCRPG